MKFKTFPEIKSISSPKKPLEFINFEKLGYPITNVESDSHPLFGCLNLLTAQRFDDGIRIYQKDSFDTKPFTVMFRIPFFDNIKINKAALESFTKYRKFFTKWELKGNGKERTKDLMKIVERYTATFYFLSVPHFFSHELIIDLKNMSAEYRVVSPDSRLAECPFCGEKTETDKTTKVITCSNCNRDFSD